MAQQVAQFRPLQLLPFKYPARALTDAYQPAPSLTVARGTIMGQITATGLVTPYAAANTDGSQVPLGPVMYDFTTDVNSLITLGSGTGTGVSFGIAQPHDVSIPIYLCGIFLEADLTGLDAGAVTALKAREMYAQVLGVASKMLFIPGP